MTFDEICDALALYLESLPTEGGRGNRDAWRDKLANTLADIRAKLASAKDVDADEEGWW